MEKSVMFLCSGAIILLLWEWINPAHADESPQQQRWSWYARALFINVINLGVFFLVDRGLLWCQENNYLSDSSLVQLLGFNLSVSPLTLAVLAYLIFTFVVYWWHRARHSNRFLWRWFHQLHHSPEQIEVLTAYYIHPFDLIANLIISNTILYAVLGADFSAAPFYTAITGLAGLIIHANIRLPRWMGYVFQTPEMHRLHHKSGHHANNYTDLVVWDMLFGTYCNPVEPIRRCGFSKPQQEDLQPLLFGQSLKINLPEDNKMNLTTPTSELIDQIISNDKQNPVSEVRFSFRDFTSFTALEREPEALSSLIRCYQQVFGEPEIWDEYYSQLEVEAMLHRQLTGNSSLRICIDNELNRVVGFCWAQSLTAKRITECMKEIKYASETSFREVEKLLTARLNHRNAIYLHDLGIAKEYRHTIPLSILILPPITSVAEQSGNNQLVFWSVAETCIAHIANKVGITPFHEEDELMFFCGNLG